MRPPTWIYGTAWKEGDTARLVREALAAGFRAIDTANQRRHYVEAAVGEAVADALREGRLTRGDLFLQTKFTPIDGQDQRIPYDAAAPLARQVEQSFASSLEHLGVDHIDAYLLHGPLVPVGLSAGDWEIWRAMEALQSGGRVGQLGVSNVSAAQLAALCAGASILPAFVQNRCYASRGWDRAVRRVCAEHGIHYQGFSLLTANWEVLHDRRVAAIAARLGATPAQVIFRFAQRVGMIPLTGTTSTEHMAQDLRAGELDLEPPEVERIETLAG